MFRFQALRGQQNATIGWFTKGRKPCGIVYGKILLENLVQSLISLTLRLGKLGKTASIFRAF
jgi:hypothetical protein